MPTNSPGTFILPLVVTAASPTFFGSAAALVLRPRHGMPLILGRSLFLLLHLQRTTASPCALGSLSTMLTAATAPAAAARAAGYSTPSSASILLIVDFVVHLLRHVFLAFCIKIAAASDIHPISLTIRSTIHLSSLHGV